MVNKKKNLIVYICTIVGALIVGACIVLLVITFSSPSPEASTNSNPSSYSMTNTGVDENQSSNEEDYAYLVKIENGVIIVYKNGESTPYETIDTDPSVLPQQDLNKLRDGIYIKTDDELRRLLEDYDG